MLVYFGGEGLPGARCGKCDHCKLWADQGGASAGAQARRRKTRLKQSHASDRVSLVVPVSLEPIPTIWGHSGGRGADKKANRFLNAKIAHFLSQP